jgi:hypothetical protein
MAEKRTVGEEREREDGGQRRERERENAGV